MDNLGSLIRGVFEPLSDAEIRLLVFERAFRELTQRGSARQCLTDALGVRLLAHRA